MPKDETEANRCNQHRGELGGRPRRTYVLQFREHKTIRENGQHPRCNERRNASSEQAKAEILVCRVCGIGPEGHELCMYKVRKLHDTVYKSQPDGSQSKNTSSQNAINK